MARQRPQYCDKATKLRPVPALTYAQEFIMRDAPDCESPVPSAAATSSGGPVKIILERKSAQGLGAGFVRNACIPDNTRSQIPSHEARDLFLSGIHGEGQTYGAGAIRQDGHPRGGPCGEGRSVEREAPWRGAIRQGEASGKKKKKGRQICWTSVGRGGVFCAQQMKKQGGAGAPGGREDA